MESAHHHPEASATSHSTCKLATVRLFICLFFMILIFTAKPKYQWRNEDKFENGFLKVKIGESPVVHFTVESEAPLAGDVQHTLTKDGKAVTKRFMVQNNIVKFKKVRLDDSGKYSISCYSNDVLVCEDTIELEVSPVATSDSAVLATPQQSQSEQL